MKKLKELDRQLAIEEVSSQLFKTVFREVKNTDMNAIQHTTQHFICLGLGEKKAYRQIHRSQEN